MEFGIQMGYGLQQATVDLVRKWGGGAVVVSPRVFRVREDASTEEAISKYCARLSRYTNEMFIDPMLYVPENLQHQISAAEYARSIVDKGKLGYLEAARAILLLNKKCSTSATILPSWTISKPDQEWSAYQETVAEEAHSFLAGQPCFATIALTDDFLKRDGCIDWIADEATRWNVEGVFLALEHPGNEYLTDEPLWLLSSLCLAAAFKRLGKKVMMGYGSHQLLIATLAKSDYLCCGNFLNVRRFNTSDFKEHKDNSPSRRAKWYYVPQALSEYKLPTLDLAKSMGVLDWLKSPYDDEYVSMLFSGALPSSTAYNEGLSFKHYLHSLHEQCLQLSADSYDEALAACQALIHTADMLIEQLKDMGVHDAQRNFARASQACGQAMSAFNTRMGFAMRQSWNWI